ncbi:hypothetical protein D3C86_1454660 [compost metagenome]
MATNVNVAAIIKASGPRNKTLTSTIIPTLIKKKGMKIAFPINSIRFISAEEWGINLFNAKPATNAPIIGSSPAISDKKAAKNTIDKIKI